MYNFELHQKLNTLFLKNNLAYGTTDSSFQVRFLSNIAEIAKLYDKIYGQHPASAAGFDALLTLIVEAYLQRDQQWRDRDESKLQGSTWLLSNELVGMSLYVDRFAGNLKKLKEKLPYFTSSGVNLLHLMPLFESPPSASDGGYAVSDFRKIDPRFGSLRDLKVLRTAMADRGLYLMLDIVLNHTSDSHEWAIKAREGDKEAQDRYYFFDDRKLPDQYDQAMPEIFPETAPGSFTYVPECEKWVMTVFHHYQWDLNYSNPQVLVSMLDNIFFYANLGVDILRIDAPAFVWKKQGTSSQNLDEAHILLRLIRSSVEVVAPGMALLGEAIVASAEIMKYFGTGEYAGRECDLAYNATLMALAWNSLATSETPIMISAQKELSMKPAGTSWITYSRSHDDIGFGFNDDLIYRAGFDAKSHRRFLREFLSGTFPGSFSRGALFSSNPRTDDARISGTLASLCGLERALKSLDDLQIKLALSRILLMQAISFLSGGIPMIFAGDERASLNDYAYLRDPAKNYDNRWMHRPVTNWKQIEAKDKPGSPQAIIYQATKKLIALRKSHPCLADLNNTEWLWPNNDHVTGFIRRRSSDELYCFFNFSAAQTSIPWPVKSGTDLWSGQKIKPVNSQLSLEPYQFCVISPQTLQVLPEKS